MNLKKRNNILIKGIKIFGLSILTLAVVAMNIPVNANINLVAAVTQPALPEATEVVYDEASTVYVNNATDFINGYRNPDISRIVLTGDITLTDANRTTINAYLLIRSLQIDGDGHTLSSTALANLNDYAMFGLRAPTGGSATFHMKNIVINTRGLNYIDDGIVASRSTGWQVILEDVNFDNSQGNQVQRVLRMVQGHLFLRGKVTMISNAENMYIGQITVEDNAEVYGEINVYDFSTWWFYSATSNGSLNVGENAKVELSGFGGATFPTVFQHFREINIFKNASFKVSKPGNALRFEGTAGVTDKYINVFEGATLDATSTGGSNAILQGNTGVRGNFYAAPGSYVTMIGTSTNASTPLINLQASGSSFELNQPAFYDLRNNLTTGSVVRVGANANFIITDSDIEVWNKGTNVNYDGKPDYSWYRSSVTADSNGTPISASDPTITSTWNTTSYSRITGLNAHPKLAFEDLTDADKSYTINATVLDKKAWIDQVTLSVTNDNQSDVQNGKNDANGKYKYTQADFFEAGTTYTATGYRGDPVWNTLDPQATVTVRDVTPPTPAVSASSIYTYETEISGTSDEPGALVSATLNGVEFLSTIDGVIVNTDGTWNFNIPESVTLVDGDVIRVFLTDASGNVNPLVDTPFRDAVFGAAATINIGLDNIAPILTADEFITYEKGIIKQEVDFLTDINATLNEPGIITTNFSPTDLDTAGLYTVTLNGTDRGGNVSNTVITKVIVTDGENTVVDPSINEEMIRAYGFTVSLTDVASTDFTLLAQAKAWNLEDGSEVAISMVGTKPTTGGIHPITFTTTKGTSITVNVTVIDNIAPILSADEFITYTKDTIKTETEFLADIHATLNEPGTIVSNFDSAYLDTAGVYPITLNGSDTAGNSSNTIVTKIIVTDGENTIVDPSINEEMIRAYGFTINLSDIPSAEFLSLAQVKAWNLEDGSEVTTSMIGVKPTTGGIHPITFTTIKGTSITVDVSVIDNISPTLSADEFITYPKGIVKTESEFFTDVNAQLDEAGTITSNFSAVNLDVAGVYAVTLNGEDTAGNNSNTVITKVIVTDGENTVVDPSINEEMIRAYGFTINLSDVSSANFISLAQAAAWDLTDGSSVVVSMLGSKPTAGGVYPITFTTIKGTSITVNVTVIDNVAPILAANEFVVYEKGTVKTETEFLTDANAFLNEPGMITSNFALVNLNIAGVYVVTLNGEDLAGNNSNTVITKVIVTDGENTIVDPSLNEEMIRAYGFTINLSDVPSANFVSLAQAGAWDLTDGSSISVSMIGEKPTTGGTHPTTFTTVNGTEIIVDVIVIDNILPTLSADEFVTYEKGTIKTETEFFTDISATLDKTGTITSSFSQVDLGTPGVYVVTLNGEDTVGNNSNTVLTKVIVTDDENTVVDPSLNEEMIQAYGFTINLSDVATADFIALGQVKAWSLDDGSILPVAMIGTKPTAGGVYPITYTTTKGTQITRDVIVVDDVMPTLSADEFITYEKGTIKTEAEFFTDVHASLDESGIITSDFNTVNLNVAGLYVVSLNGTDDAGNNSNTVVTKVIVTDGDYTVVDQTTNEEMIRAYDFSINLSDVASANFITLARAKAWNLSDGNEVPVTMIGTKPTTGGIHQVTFETTKGTTITIDVNITDNVPPVLSANEFVIYTKDTVKTEAEFLIDANALLNKSGTITTNFNPTNLNTAGVYLVTLNGVDTSGNGSNTVITKVIVTDGENTIVNQAINEEMIRAYEFTINLSSVSTADFITLAQVRGWDLEDGSEVAVHLVTMKPTDAGTYPMTYATNKGTTITRDVVVIDDVAPILVADEFVTYEKGTIKTEAEFFSDAHASLNEAGTITSTFSSVNLNIAGVYVVTLHGQDLAGNPSNTVITKIIVTDDDNTVVDQATNEEMIRAYGFTISLSEVPMVDFLVLGQVKAWDLTNGNEVTTTMVGNKPTTGGVHPITFTTTKGTSITVDVIVVDNVAPILSADEFITYTKGTIKTEVEFLTDINATLDEAGTITSNFSSTDVNTAGVYVVTLNGVDLEGNGSNTVITKVIVTDGDNTVVDQTTNEEMIRAYGFTINLSDVANANFILLSQAKAWDLTDGSEVALSMTSTKPTIGGVHPITFTTVKGTSITVDVTVVDDVDPILSADEFITYTKGTIKTETEFLIDINATLNEPGTITSNFSPIDVNTAGVYVVTLNGVDTANNASNTVTTKVIVTDGDNTVVDDTTNEEMIRAYGFTIELSDVATANFVTLAKAGAWDLTDGSSVDVTRVTEKPNVGGTHPITFTTIKGTVITVDVIVLDNIVPILTADEFVIYEKGTAKTEAEFFTDITAVLNEAGTITSNFDLANLNIAGVYAVTLNGEDLFNNPSNTIITKVIVTDGDNTVVDPPANQEMIRAYEFTINLSDVAAANFSTLANAKAWDLVSGDEVAVSRETDKPTTGGVHPITFTTVKGTKITVDITVVDNVAPILSADEFVMYTKGTIKTENEFIADVSATLNEAGVITTDFATVDLNVAGVYVVTLNGKDLAGNNSNVVITKVIVTDGDNTVVDQATNEEMIRAYGFTINLSDVADANFITLSQVKAWNLVDGNMIPVTMTSTKPTAGGTYSMTYTTTKGTTISRDVIVIDNVAPILSADEFVTYEKGSIKIESEFLADVNATLNELGTITSNFVPTYLNTAGVYVVTLNGVDTAGNGSNTVTTKIIVTDGDNTVVDPTTNEEMIRAYDFTINLSDVTTADFILLANAKAWDLNSGDEVAVVLTSVKPTTGGVHQSTFVTAKGTSIIISVTVTDDINPILTADEFITYEKGTIKTEDAFLTDVNATLDEPGTIISNFNTANLNVAGVYTITLNGNDTAGNSSNSVITKIIVTDNDNTVVDPSVNEEMIRAYGFTISLSEIEAADFILLAKVKAWDLTTGNEIAVAMVGAKPTIGGTHPITFTTTNGTTITVDILVIDNVVPILSADEFVTYTKGASKTETEFFTDVNAMLNEAGTITSDFVTVDLNTAGVYVVTLNGIDTAGNGSNTVITKVIVIDGDNTVVDPSINEEMIRAYGFTINLSVVEGADFNTLAQAKAWNLIDGSEVEVTMTTTKPTIGGTHPITFVTTKGTSITVDVLVIDNVAPVLMADEFVVYEKDTIKTEAEFLADIHATLNEPGNITSNFIPANINTAGVYLVLINGEDTAGNTSNTVITKVIVTDGDNTVVDPSVNEEMIRAYDFTINLSAVPSSNFVALSQSRAWDLTTGGEVTVTMVGAKPTTGGTHLVTFTTAKGTTITINATVIDDVAPILTADEFITYEKGTVKTEVEFLTDIHADLNEPGTIMSTFSPADLNTAGVYVITLNGEDTAGNSSNTVMAKVIVTDGDNTVVDPSVNEEMIRAYDFTINLSAVPSANFVALSQSRAWDLTTGGEVTVTMVGAKPTTGGTHLVTFTTAKGTTITINVTVIDDVAPILTADEFVTYEKGTVKTEAEFLMDTNATLNEVGTITSNFETTNLNTAGVYVIALNGEDTAGNPSNTVIVKIIVTDDENTVVDPSINEEMIRAYGFIINLSEVEGANFVTLSQAKAWNLADGSEVATSMLSAKPTVGGTHPITFTTVKGTTITIDVIVIDNVAPILSADEFVMYEKGTIKTEAEFFIDAHAMLNEAGAITSNFDTVNLNIAGVYPVVLNGQDTAGNISNSVITKVIVADGENTVVDPSINEEMIRAYGFTINLSEVENTNFITLSQTKAWNLTDGSEIAVTMISTKPTTGGVHPITFTTTNGTSITVDVTVVDNVDPILTADEFIAYEKGTIKTETEFLLDVNAALNEAGTITSNFTPADLNTAGVYLVILNGVDVSGNNSNTVITKVIVTDGDNTVVDPSINKEMIYAKGFTISLSDVATANFIVDAQVKAWDLTTGAEVSVIMETAKPTTGGVHQITFKTDKGTSITVPVTVLDNINPILTADELIIYEKGTMKAEAEFLSDVNATLNEAGTITSDFGQVDLNTVGIYFVILNGTDIASNPSNTVITRVIVKNGENTTVDIDINEEMIYATGFTLNLSNVETADFITLAQAKAWDLTNGNTVVVSMPSEKPTTGGVHQITFVTDKGTSVTVSITIVDDVAPILSADEFISYEKGTVKTEAEFLSDVHANLNETGIITSDFLNVDLMTAGVYVVNLNGKDTTGNISNSVVTKVIVTDGDNTVVDPSINEEMIRAYGFTINLTEVETSDFITLSQAKAWNLVTGDEVNVSMVNNKPTTAGVYSITFTTDKGTTITVEVVVVEDDIIITLENPSVRYLINTTPTDEELINDYLVDVQTVAPKLSLARVIPETISLTIDRSNVDITTVGTYEIIFTATDTTTGKTKSISGEYIVYENEQPGIPTPELPTTGAYTSETILFSLILLLFGFIIIKTRFKRSKQ